MTITTAATRPVRKAYGHRNRIQGKQASIWLDAGDQEIIARLTKVLGEANYGVQKPSLIILVRAGLKMLDDHIKALRHVV
jgi:hypothetical protein